MSSQLPLSAWFAILARSAAVQPSRSSRMACLRVLGSVFVGEASIAQPVVGRVLSVSRTVSRADDIRLRRGYAPRPR
eukprot:5468385-Pleurochrysis_carterae.AAC.3